MMPSPFFLAADGGSGSNFFYLLETGSWFMWLLLACSVVSVTLIVHRFLALQADRVVPEALLLALRRAEEKEGGGYREAVALAIEGHPSTLSRILRPLLRSEQQGPEEAQAALESRAREEVVFLQWGLSALEVVTTIGPLLGLLGTVSGLVGVFGGLEGSALTESGAEDRIAAGIAEALLTTIAGLAVAVPSVIFHTHFTTRVERLAARMEVVAVQVLHRLLAPDQEAILQETSRKQG
ncbi:MAG: MotA/TolQ/ExbB proton channel family protein [Verrucomicrobiota bacterium]